MIKNFDNNKYRLVFENVIRRLINEGFYDNEEYNDIDPFEEYEKGYPNSDFDVSDMTKTDLAKWCDTVGDFLYIYNGLRGWSVMNANSSEIINEIVGDVYNCSHIEPTHEMDYLLYRYEREFQYSYVCVFKIYNTKDGDYYIIYQQDK